MIAFSEVMADIGNHGKYGLSLYDMGRFMRLDAAAQRALNVMKTKFDANDNFSLYGLMSRARTSMGKRLLKARFHPPLSWADVAVGITICGVASMCCC